MLVFRCNCGAANNLNHSDTGICETVNMCGLENFLQNISFLFCFFYFSFHKRKSSLNRVVIQWQILCIFMLLTALITLLAAIILQR